MNFISRLAHLQHRRKARRRPRIIATRLPQTNSKMTRTEKRNFRHHLLHRHPRGTQGNTANLLA